jgi:Sec-independent protein translocase protein TatA
MGVLRGAGIVILSVLLFVSLLCGGVCLTLAMSLSYENVQPTVVGISKNVITQAVDLKGYVNELKPSIDEYCKSNSEYVFSFEGHVFVIPCSVVNQGTDAIINYAIDNSVTGAVEEYYYKNYECNLIQCLKKGEVTFLISKQASDYWMSKFYLFLGISVAFIVLLFLLAEKKTNWFFLVGALFGASSFVIYKLNSIGIAIAKAFLLSLSELFSGNLNQELLKQIVGLFFVEYKRVFIFMLGIGVVLIVLGIFFKLFNIGFKINNLIDKIKKEDSGDKEYKEEKEKVSKEEVKKMVKQQVKKQVEKEVQEQVQEKVKQDVSKPKSKKK